jgi:hypothetical protein
VLASNLEDTSVSFLHVRALCLVPLQFPQRRRASWPLSRLLLLRAFFNRLAATEALAATYATAVLYSIVLLY